MKTGKVYKFNKLELAESFANRTVKMSVIIMGDDGKYWVAIGADAQQLISNGYEAL